MKKYLITNYSNYIISMIFEEGRPSCIHAYDKKEETLLGNVYIGRVKDVVKNINSAFVEIGRDKICYYSLSDNTHHNFLNKKNTDKVCQGDLLLVQVSKEAIKSKAPGLSSDISFSGNYIVLSLDGNGEVAISSKIKDSEFKKNIKSRLKPLVKEAEGRFSFIVRTAATEVDIEEVVKEANYYADIEKNIHIKSVCRPAFTCLYEKEPEYLVDLRETKLAKEDEVVTDDKAIFEVINNGLFLQAGVRLYEDRLLPMYKLYSLEKHLYDALNKHVWLKSGADIVIEITEALTVVDVNTGKYDGNKKNREETFLKINMEAASEIARQLKLRNISGIIIVDFINLESQENRIKLIDHISEELKKDSVPAFFIDFTKLGLAEITRKKIKRPLHEIISIDDLKL